VFGGNGKATSCFGGILEEQPWEFRTGGVNYSDNRKASRCTSSNHESRDDGYRGETKLLWGKVQRGPTSKG